MDGGSGSRSTDRGFMNRCGAPKDAEPSVAAPRSAAPCMA